VLLTGGGAPIYRAFVSSVCGLLIFNNQTSQVYALTMVVMIMTIINPLGTLYDPSFHLTCCATYGLIMFTKRFDKMIIFSRLNFTPDFLREIISVTLATQVFVFPYIVFMSGSFSSVFLISNVLVLPLIPIIMFLGFISLFSDFAVNVNNVILKIVFYIVRNLASVPYGYFEFSENMSLMILIVYGVCMLLWFYKRKNAGAG
jgi:competence protein ComEC